MSPMYIQLPIEIPYLLTKYVTIFMHFTGICHREKAQITTEDWAKGRSTDREHSNYSYVISAYIQS
jgi:hypothetical protein